MCLQYNNSIMKICCLFLKVLREASQDLKLQLPEVTLEHPTFAEMV